MNTDIALHTNAQHAEKFAAVALSHITREFPNKLDHVLLSDDDARSPRVLHPIFYGSFDWHSCVHGYWLLARVYRRFPDVPQANRIRALFDAHFTAANVAVETEYAAHPSRSGFERPYGWAWLLQLSAELHEHDTDEARTWAASLQPLADVFAQRFMDFLPKATYPIRTGTHYNTAFAVTLAMEYATRTNHVALRTLLHETARRWFQHDINAQAWEPSGDDFLSSTLMEAVCMQRVLPATEFAHWFATFLPDVARQLPAKLFTPATVSDRTDGKIAHLDGLNLSRAWCWRTLAAQRSPDDPKYKVFLAAASDHLRSSLPHVSGDYMGEHWLATFALLALEA